MRIALAGNPNSGKSTLFNALTGSSQNIGNWPGVTIEKKVGKLKGEKDVDIIDLPGIYSLSPYSPEEVIARNYILEERPDVIINVVDVANIERNLYLTTQLLETDIPVVIALNMMDIAEKRKDIIDISGLSGVFGCDIISTSAIGSRGYRDVAQQAMTVAKNKKGSGGGKYFFSENAIQYFKEAESVLKGQTDLKYSAVRLLSRDDKILGTLDSLARESAENITARWEKERNDSIEGIIADERYSFICNILKYCIVRKNNSINTISDRIDKVITNRFLAVPIFMAVMFLVYYVSVTTIGTVVTDWTNDVLFGSVIPSAVENWLESVHIASWINSLILDGIIGGVGAVLGFVPQLLVLFLFLVILEECGYLSRVAFVLDKIFRSFGLSGKSVIPLLIGTGCGVPGIMACSTINSEQERRITIITTTFIPCSAKLPIIALIAGAVFGGAVWVAASAYFAGILSVLISGLILKKFHRFSGLPTPFIMELPIYRVPRIKDVLMRTMERAWEFVKKAGTIIFISCGMVWFLSAFNFGMDMVSTDKSILAGVGKVIAPVFNPLGFGTWENTVATFTGLIAKENVVGTFGILFGFSEVAENGKEIWSVLAGSFNGASAYSFLIFNLLCAPCFAAIGAIKRELGDVKLASFAVAYQTVFAYCAAFLVYQLGIFFTNQHFNILTAVAFVLIAGFIYLILRKESTEKN